MTNDLRTDVVLVRPRDIGAVPPGAPVQDPLGVGYLAAVLRSRDYEVAVVDAHALNLDDDGIVTCVAQLKPIVVGLSLHSFSDYVHCVTISKGLSEIPDQPYCIWGGEHATFHAENILRQHVEVDAVVLGEGEETFCEIVQRITAYRIEHIDRKKVGFHKHSIRLGSIIGAVVRDREGISHGGFRAAIEDLDTLPIPHKDSVEIALSAGKPVTISILTGRGCLHQCKFCTAHEFMRLGGGKVWRRRSPKLVVDELETLITRYMKNPLVHSVIQFQDVIFLGTSNASKKWISVFLDEMKQRHLRVPFYCMARADAILANEHILTRLVEVGFWSVEIGIEGGVDRILSLYNKRNSALDNERAVKLLRTYGITFDASGFIMFDPRMTLDELRENAGYLSKFGAATWDFFVTRLQLYPGTEVRAEMIAKGLFDGANNIGKTSGYKFEDPRVGLVAKHTFYYDLSIRTLDLLLRNAKAVLAKKVRCGEEPEGPIADAVTLVHETYCRHLLTLADLAESGEIEKHVTQLNQSFIEKIKKLTILFQEIGIIVSHSGSPHLR